SDMAAASEEGRAGAARRVDRGVRHRDRDKMDQCQSEADRDTGKTGRRALGGGSDDDEQKKERHHHFHQETAGEAVFAGAEIAVAIGSETTRDPPWLARRDEP